MNMISAVGASSFGAYKTDNPNGSFRLSAGRFRARSCADNGAGALKIEILAFHYVMRPGVSGVALWEQDGLANLLHVAVRGHSDLD
jgi:hypothetical protein